MLTGLQLGFTALHTMAQVVDDTNEAAVQCFARFCKQFKHLVNDKASSAEGQCPLGIVSARGSVTLAQVLLDTGASVSTEDKYVPTISVELLTGCLPFFVISSSSPTLSSRLTRRQGWTYSLQPRPRLLL